MKKSAIVAMLLAGAVAFAQQSTDQQTSDQQQPAPPPPASLQQSVQEPLPTPPPQAKVKSTNLIEKQNKPNDEEIYCAGFLSSAPIGEIGVVSAGWDTPHQTRFTEPNYIYIKGSGFQEGAQYLIIRKLRDPNRYEVFKGQHGALNSAGQAYADIARAQVITGGVRGNLAIAKITHTCDTVVPGDYAVPLQARPDPEFKYTGDFDPFAPADGKLTGRIIMARDFDNFVGTGSLVYLSVGAENGVKPGDYFRITRTYSAIAKDPVDSLSFKAAYTEDTQANNVKIKKADLDALPRQSLGELMILNVHPKSATALITSSLQTINVGDGVEMFEPPPPPPPPPPPAPTTPTISCVANPDTVHKGESSTITCQAASPDGHPIAITFANTGGGSVNPRDNNAVLDTAQVQAPAAVNVTGTVTDDRDQSASSTATVNVQAPVAPPAPTSQQVLFKPRSSYVDNRAKALLDGVALQLQQTPDATAVVVGRVAKGEPATLAQKRADNIKIYLTASKGVDEKRITTQTGTGEGRIAEVWIVPAGATLPAEAGTTAAPAEATAPLPKARKKAAAKKAAK